MSSNGPLSRRELLGALVAATLPWMGLMGFPTDVGRRRKATTTWLSMVGHRRSRRVIGRAYLAASQDTIDAGTLLCQLTPPADASATGWTDNAERLRTHVRSLIADDFEAGRTVQLHGWMLSETEARVCALIALL